MVNRWFVINHKHWRYQHHQFDDRWLQPLRCLVSFGAMGYDRHLGTPWTSQVWCPVGLLRLGMASILRGQNGRWCPGVPTNGIERPVGKNVGKGGDFLFLWKEFCPVGQYLRGWWFSVSPRIKEDESGTFSHSYICVNLVFMRKKCWCGLIIRKLATVCPWPVV